MIAVAVFLPVELIVKRAISPALLGEILEKSGQERILNLQANFCAGLNYFRIAVGLLGGWLLLLFSGWNLILRWTEEVTFRPIQDGSEEVNLRREVWFPAVWALFAAVICIPLLFKGIDTGELVNLAMLAKRGVLATIACQNLPPRAAQQGFTIFESIFVTLFGDSELVARLPALLFGVAAMFPFYFLARRFGNVLFANLVCAALSVTGFYLFYSTYARGYSLAMMLYVACVLMVADIRRASTWVNWWILGILFVLACYTHQACGLYIAFLCAVLMIERITLLDVRPLKINVVLKSFVQPIAVMGTVCLMFLVLFSVTIPSSFGYTNRVSLTDYYMSYHVNFRLLKVMAESWALVRDFTPLAWLQAILSVAGLILAARKRWWLALYLVVPVILSLLFIWAGGYYVFTRYFLQFLPVYVLFSIYPVWLAIERRQPVIRWAGTVVVVIGLTVSGTLTLQRLYSMERCGIRSAVNDARQLMSENESILGVLDAYITVKYYYSFAESAYHDKDFWRVINSSNIPPFAVSVPYLDMDIPSGSRAFLARYEVYRKYPSWLDVDDDQDSVYLYRRKP